VLFHDGEKTVSTHNETLKVIKQ